MTLLLVAPQVEGLSGRLVDYHPPLAINVVEEGEEAPWSMGLLCIRKDIGGFDEIDDGSVGGEGKIEGGGGGGRIGRGPAFAVHMINMFVIMNSFKAIPIYCE